MKQIVLAIAILSLVSCQTKSYKLKDINGYWEITEAKTPYGTKQYKMSSNIDYFYLESDSAGLRKKVQPSLMGKYATSEDSEKFSFFSRNDSLFIRYNSVYDEWTEYVINLTEDKLILKNESETIYTYKRFEPINVTENETEE